MGYIMTLSEIYKLSVQMGMDADPRGKEGAEKVLSKTKEGYEKLDEWEKEYFDTEAFTNPYSDSRILFGDPDKEIKKILTGIDIEGDELLVAKQLGDIDACVAHHPRGRALAKLDDVLYKRISEVTRGLSPSNHFRAVEIARLLGMPYMCAHTVTDNLVFQFLKAKFEEGNFDTVKDILDMLMTIPEYQEAKRRGSGPMLFAGKNDNRAGKIAITEITGGTEGAHDIYEKMANAGIGTVIGMHQSEKHVKFAEEAHINVVIAGHMSSDSIGLNIFLDALEERGVEIVPCSGLLRVNRSK